MASAGWYQDPHSDTQLRYFDGNLWTEHTQPHSTRPPAPGVALPGPPGQNSDFEGIPGEQMHPGPDGPARAPAIGRAPLLVGAGIIILVILLAAVALATGIFHHDEPKTSAGAIATVKTDFNYFFVGNGGGFCAAIAPAYRAEFLKQNNASSCPAYVSEASASIKLASAFFAKAGGIQKLLDSALSTAKVSISGAQATVVTAPSSGNGIGGTTVILTYQGGKWLLSGGDLGGDNSPSQSSTSFSGSFSTTYSGGLSTSPAANAPVTSTSAVVTTPW